MRENDILHFFLNHEGVNLFIYLLDSVVKEVCTRKILRAACVTLDYYLSVQQQHSLPDTPCYVQEKTEGDL